MQSLHPSKRAPQRQPGVNEALTETVEQGNSFRPTEAFTNRPDVQIDDLPPERGVEARRARQLLKLVQGSSLSASSA
jgi:hypothetical protein